MPTEEAPNEDAISGGLGESDRLILAALNELESSSAKKKLKLTVGSLEVLSGLSTNTIRSRKWALVKLKRLKIAEKERRAKSKVNKSGDEREASVSFADAIEMRVTGLLRQNALLFEEILSLRRQLKKYEEYIENIQGRRVTLL